MPDTLYKRAQQLDGWTAARVLERFPGCEAADVETVAVLLTESRLRVRLDTGESLTTTEAQGVYCMACNLAGKPDTGANEAHARATHPVNARL